MPNSLASAPNARVDSPGTVSATSLGETPLSPSVISQPGSCHVVFRSVLAYALMAVSGSTTIFAPFLAASRISGSSPFRFSAGLANCEMNWMAATRTVLGCSEVQPPRPREAAHTATTNINEPARNVPYMAALPSDL